MTFSTRATLTVSILALVAGGPLSAQSPDLGMPAADEQGLFDEMMVSDPIASEPLPADNSVGEIFYGSDGDTPAADPMSDPNLPAIEPGAVDPGAQAVGDILYGEPDAPPPLPEPLPIEDPSNGLDPYADTGTLTSPGADGLYDPSDAVPFPTPQEEPVPAWDNTQPPLTEPLAPSSDPLSPDQDPTLDPMMPTGEGAMDDAISPSQPGTDLPTEAVEAPNTEATLDDLMTPSEPVPAPEPLDGTDTTDAPFADITEPSTDTPLILPEPEGTLPPVGEDLGQDLLPESTDPNGEDAPATGTPADTPVLDPQTEPTAPQEPAPTMDAPAPESPVDGMTDPQAPMPTDDPLAEPSDTTEEALADPTVAEQPAPAPVQEPSPLQDAPEPVDEEIQEAIAADPLVQDSIQALESLQTSTDAPLAAEGGAAVGQPIVRTIEETRTADEEFLGTVSAAPLFQATGTSTDEQRARAERERERDIRRARLEGAGLGAIAGLVVGAIISDRQEVVATSPERVVVVDRSTNVYQVWRDDDAILRRPGVREETTVYPDGSVKTVLIDPNGTRIETIRNATGRVLKRERIVDNRRVVIVDDLRPIRQVNTQQLPAPRIPRVFVPRNVDPVLGAQLIRTASTQVDRAFSLGQIRNIWEVRRLVPVLDTDPVLFATGSSALGAQQANALSGLASVMLELLRTNPGETFLVEGHTDAVGSAAFNLALSDRRAESVAQALVDYFGIPPENLVFQGYGESLLAVPTQNDEPRNRRVEIRRITPLLHPDQG